METEGEERDEEEEGRVETERDMYNVAGSTQLMIYMYFLTFLGCLFSCPFIKSIIIT